MAIGTGISVGSAQIAMHDSQCHLKSDCGVARGSPVNQQWVMSTHWWIHAHIRTSSLAVFSVDIVAC